MAAEPPSAKRSDARINREELLDVAGDLIAERGVEVPLYLVAKGAGVGPATLYRHFPDRHALLCALAWRSAQMFSAVGMAAAAAESGWDKITTFLDGVLALHLRSPWLSPVADYARAHPPEGWVTGKWDAALLAVVQQAKDEGSLRLDVEVTDVVFLPILLAKLVSYPEPLRGTVIARHRALMLDSLRPQGAPRPELGAEALSAEVLKAVTEPRARR